MNVVTKMEAHLGKEVAELEKLALDMCSVPTEVKKIISNEKSSRQSLNFRVRGRLWLWRENLCWNMQNEKNLHNNMTWERLEMDGIV